MLKYSVVVLALFLGVVAQAEPQLVLTYKGSYNGYATVAGKVIGESRAGKVYAITAQNAGLKYSALCDADGSWAIVFRHANVNFEVRAWDPANPGREVSVLKDRLESE